MSNSAAAGAPRRASRSSASRPSRGRPRARCSTAPTRDSRGSRRRRRAGSAPSRPRSPSRARPGSWRSGPRARAGSRPRRRPCSSRRAQEVDVLVHVVGGPVAVPGVRPDVERLHEAVDVLGHAQLLDPALRGRLAVAVDVRRGEVALRRRVVLVGAQVHVVVGQHSAASARARSASVVTLKFPGGASTSRTVPAGGLHQRGVVGGGRQRGVVDVERAAQRRPPGTPAASAPPTGASGRACAARCRRGRPP